MITRRTKAQIAVFGLIAVLVLLYTAVSIASVNPFNRPFVVRLQLASTGGLYTGSDVTYRGVHIGKVQGIELKRDGVVATLRLDKGTKVNADTSAAVTDLSPIGQQYVDLRPSTTTGPYLHDGSTIAATKVTLPPTAAVVLSDVDRLLLSIDPDQLNSLVNELYATFNGLSPSLQQILASTSHVATVLNQNAPQTNTLLTDAQTVLDTQVAEEGDLASFARSLHQLSSTLKASDADLRSLIARGNAASQQVLQLLNPGTRSDVALLLGNLVTTTQIVNLRLPALTQLVVSLPTGLNALSSAAPGDTLLMTVTQDVTPACDYGTPTRTPYDTAVIPPPLDHHCTETAPNEQQRGSQYVPRPEVGSTGGQQALLGRSSWLFLLLDGAR